MSNKQNQNRTATNPLVRRDDPAPVDEDRSSREQADYEREDEDGTVLTMSERKKLLRREWEADLLPTVEDPSGYWHYCWLSSSNNTDPIYRRLKLGYELVKYEKMSSLGVQNQITSGEFAGCVAVNEMILARIPTELYSEIMLINHHERPMEEEQLLKANAILKGDQDLDSEGNRLGSTFGEGIQKLGERRRAPNSF